LAAAPPLAAAALLHAEGPVAFLAAWGAAVVVLAAAAGRASVLGRRLRRLAALSAAVLGGAGAFVVLVQLNVAKRSLAEAWLALARSGEAFGSFSFFAAELVALLCLGPALLALRGRTAAALAGLGAVGLFFRGLIGDSAPALAVAIAAAAAVPLLSGRGASRSEAGGSGLLRRLRAGAAPLGAAVVLSLPLALLPPERAPGPVRIVDLTPLVRAVAPAFPLLLDVPGYGYEVGGAELAPSVYLTENALFEAEADGGGLRYLVSAVYEDWTGTAWREARVPGREIRVQARNGSEPRPAGALRLRLAEDFYSLVPVERSTGAVLLSPGAPPARSAEADGGVRFDGSAKRGLVADLLAERGAEAGDAPEGRWAEPGPDPSGRIAELARDLARRGGEAAGGEADRDRRVAEAIRSHFAENGFSYTTSVRGGGGAGTDLERFLFQDKMGYCVHYATAFVILARRAGIPARVVEGFRADLDRNGRGVVRGVNAHAWAEAWIGGAWRVVEPTPPFSAEDPFAFLAAGDAPARRQLEALFGRNAADARKAAAGPATTRKPPAVAAVAAVLAAAAAAAALATALRRSGEEAEVRTARREAARLVARGRALGVGGPETLGWTGWAAAVRAAEEQRGKGARRKEGREDPEAVAGRMIAIAFGAERMDGRGRKKTKGAR
jgi:transglutaminase-like putative cysteine protease